MKEFSIRQRQLETATAMLNLNSTDWQPNWKFLINDVIGENILAPLLSVDQLKAHNVTLRLSLDSKESREPVPDVSAVYFVFPSDENIQIICEDLTNHLYDSYYLNFISPISEVRLQTIANAALKSESAASIQRVYDQYLNFIATQDDFFVLRDQKKQQISFQAFYRPDATDEEINDSLDAVVDGLFSVLVRLKVLPIIRSPKGGPAEFIANKLNEKIKETISNNKNTLYNLNQLTFRRRPILCIVDRDVDMSTPMHHAWTYQALIHDTLNTQMNKVEVLEEDAKSYNKNNNLDSEKCTKITQYELDPSEQFWIDHRGSPFPQVAEAIQRSLDKYKKREEGLNNSRTSMGLDEPNSEARSGNDPALSLPELTKIKAMLKKHTSLATSVLDQIKARKLDNFSEIEEKIMNRNVIDRVQLDEMLTEPDYGLPSDKYRLFLIACICDNPELSEDDLERYIAILEVFGCNRKSFDFVQHWKAMSKSNVAQLQSSLQSSGQVIKTSSMFSKLMSKGSKFVMEGVKNLVLKEHHLPLTKIMDGLMDTSSTKSRESIQYLYLDPEECEVSEDNRMKTFREGIVFVVGGGNYMEYQNLVDYSRSKNHSGLETVSRKIIYGATDLMNGEQFLNQLNECI